MKRGPGACGRHKMGTGSDGCEVPVPILESSKPLMCTQNKNRPGRPHPAVPATFSRTAGEALERDRPGCGRTRLHVTDDRKPAIRGTKGLTFKDSVRLVAIC